MNLFLRAKHWQLFILVFGVPFLLQIVMMLNMVAAINHNRDQAVFITCLKLFPLLMALFMVTLFGWQWSVATRLQKALPARLKMKLSRFKTFFIIPMVYLVLMMVGITWLFWHGWGFVGSPHLFLLFFTVIFPLHLFCVFSLFYCLYFIAKTLKTAELQRAVTFNDFAGEFFLIWFFPIGVWFVQPRINKIAADLANGDPVIKD
ncbi:hypothetical protein [Mucilaginibacter sp. UR6-11]|uniref:hypothetical protein n=1 Tax=Mucilaginibacter sp. UR6-11 TaxID=1435644 RepID=UPI001E5EA125|nr:hypothetical protein [Mucilaginibacter sp. UR6-11]MCC8424501.1 hypothetical protein [Mucilaginibacter sp. UR6-11]